ncbi:MAG: restriction endonuclease subunit S, partial [Euryarchaeota archaeon]|nr:restriction endonuclease subunit S [Euryarchaeota archaeon]
MADGKTQKRRQNKTHRSRQRRILGCDEMHRVKEQMSVYQRECTGYVHTTQETHKKSKHLCILSNNGTKGEAGMTEWNEGLLSDVAEIIMGQSPKGDTCNSSGIGSPLLNGPTEFGIKNPIPIQFTENPKKVSAKNDILFCVRGSTTGRMNWADQQYAIGRGIAVIRHKEGEDYKHFIKGIIDFNLPILLASATGSTFPNVSRSQLEELEINIPPLPEQKAIASVLSSLDDKIDLLHRQNKTLEAMAKTLFRQWFVEEADEGWEEGVLGDVIELVYGKGLKQEVRTGKGYPVVGSSGIVGYHSDFLVKGPGIVIGRKGTLGKVIYLFENFFPI